MNNAFITRTLRASLVALGCGLASLAAIAQASADGAPPVAVPAQRVAHALQAEMLGIAGAGPRFVAVGDHGVVLLSDDAGKAWRQAKSVPVDVKLNSTSFVDAKQGWAVGHRGVILHTQDGGETWALQRMAAQEDRPLFAVHFFDASHGVAVGLWSLVLVTDDGGKSWKEQKLTPPPGSKTADLNLLALFADGKGRLLATAEKGMLLVSDDQGHAWRYIETGYKGSFWTGVAVDNAWVVAGLRGSLYRSTDDGAHWDRIDTHSTSSITGLAARGSRVLAVGLDGLVLDSQDGGAHFKPALREDRLSLTAATLLPDDKAILLSRSGPVDAASR
ncbi:YCF48-related protein [Variovorax sp. dw_954]|uniref:WD40/YVTN/BNR-like repeat-containing protein n=1 Tax=Variovorax sp. dw_954 TaxID=2720078 RepID=UPI001BD6311D|nr:YCF48-related protein [Variovorax sp. dw_954]